MIQIHQTAAQQLAEHARSTYPNECVGLLLGTIAADGTLHATALYPTENRWQGQVALAPTDDPTSQRDRFYLDPRDYLAADRAARQQGLDVIGCYHSHPDHPAIPSERDRVGAQGVGSGTSFAFLIQRVQQGTPAELRAWFLVEQGSQFRETPLTIKDDTD